MKGASVCVFMLWRGEEMEMGSDREVQRRTNGGMGEFLGRYLGVHDGLHDG